MPLRVAVTLCISSGRPLRHFQFQLQVTYTLHRNGIDTQRVVSCNGNLLIDGLQIARQEMTEVPSVWALTRAVCPSKVKPSTRL